MDTLLPMKTKTLLVAILLAFVFGSVMPRQAEASVTFSYFYENLQPYGEWLDVQDYGYCWQPVGMPKGWRPYTNGSWAYTNAGWTWISNEEFGSITYHYGRWINLEGIGWIWRPDYTWGPAWVSWRQSDDYIGWAPLPPEADFRPEVGLGIWVDRDYDVGPAAYTFCETRFLGEPLLRNYFVPRNRNSALIHSSLNITNITLIESPGQGRIVFNGGLDYRRISARSEHRIEMLELVRRTERDWGDHHRQELSRIAGNQLIINAPVVEAPLVRFAPPKELRVISAPKIDKGWLGVADAAERERIKQRYQEQTRGMTRTTAPATPVDVQQIQTMFNGIRAVQAQGQQVRTQAEEAQRLQQAQIHAAQTQAEQAKHMKEQAAEQQKKALEFQAHAQRDQQEQAQRLQQAQIQAAQAQAEQAKRVQMQAAEQQQKVLEVQAHALRDQQEQAQRLQQAQIQAAQAQAEQANRMKEQAAEQQKKALEVQAHALRDQQEQAQRLQQAQIQAAQAQAEQAKRVQMQAAEQQHKAMEAQARALRDQQEQAQRLQQAQIKAAQAQAEMARRAGQPTPTPDKKNQ